MARAARAGSIPRGARQEPAEDLRLERVRRDLPKLDRLIHEKLRLGIVSALAASTSLSFAELKELLDTTDGNLSVHARRLEDAGYVECEKSFQQRVPRSVYRLTKQGRAALERYLDHMEALVSAMRGGTE